MRDYENLGQLAISKPKIVVLANFYLNKEKNQNKDFVSYLFDQDDCRRSRRDAVGRERWLEDHRGWAGLSNGKAYLRENDDYLLRTQVLNLSLHRL